MKGSSRTQFTQRSAQAQPSSPATRRRLLGWAVGGGAAVAGALIAKGSSAPHAAAQPSASIVGSWLATTTRQPNLITFFADGAFLTSNPPVQIPPAGAPATALSVTAGQGVWRQSADQTVAYTFIELEYDEQTHLFATTTISGSVSLDASLNAGSGTYIVQVANPAGDVVFRDSGTLQLTRIDVNSAA